MANDNVLQSATVEVVEIGTDVKHTDLEYIYVTIPAEYVCVYHRILAMLADYGVEMLKDCKATCKDRNSGVIECFNMFNAAVAARQLGKSASNNGDNAASDKYSKLAATLIKYIKAKINQIYGGKDNETSFVFPVDENGELKAFVSCGERPLFKIRPEDGNLYEHKFHNGFDEHFRLGKEDMNEDDTISSGTTLNIPKNNRLDVNMRCWYENINDSYRPCADIIVRYNGAIVDVNDTSYSFYFDDNPVRRFNDVTNVSVGRHIFACVIKYKGLTAVAEEEVRYEN